MRELVEYMAKALVENPEAVTVTESLADGVVNLDLKVAQEDMGKIIGKQGRIAKAMRVVLKAAAVREDKKCNLEIF
ncbi:MAG: KH domain-containing protein [Clostridiales bacterium]|nr:KH domain-containing protein [Clostridiales bacterium]